MSQQQRKNAGWPTPRFAGSANKKKDDEQILTVSKGIGIWHWQQAFSQASHTPRGGLVSVGTRARKCRSRKVARE